MRGAFVFIVFILLVFSMSFTSPAEEEVDVIVLLKEPPKPNPKVFHAMQEDVAEEVGGTNRRHFRSFNGYSTRVNRKQLEELKNNPLVVGVYENEIYHTMLDESAPLINVTKVYGITQNSFNITGSGETICVIDSGIDSDHSAFSGRILDEACFCSLTNADDGFPCCPDNNATDDSAEDDFGHGTHVAGIAAGDYPVYRGIAPDAGIVAMKVCNASGSCATTDIVSAIDWCVSNSSLFNISVISMSLGGGRYFSTCDASQTAFSTAVNSAVNANISVVIASGNGYWSDSISSPGCINKATTIGATNSTDNISAFSNRAPFLDLLAPGGTSTGSGTCPDSSRICAPWFDGHNKSLSGTSMATPHVSGAIALLRQFIRLQDGTVLTPRAAEVALNETGLRKKDSFESQSFTRIDIYEALLQLDTLSPTLTFTSSSVANNTFSKEVNETINISSTEILVAAWIDYNSTNTTLTGSGTSWYFIASGNGAFNYTVYGNDSAGNMGVSEMRLLEFGNYLPQISNLSIVSNDSSNLTNGTLTAFFSVSDQNGDNYTNETRWYNNSVLTSFLNTSTVLYDYIRKNENWTFSIRAYDGMNFTNWQNVTIMIRNAVPEIEPIDTHLLNESAQLNISINASDIDNDAFSYTINSTDFSLFGTSFVWNTTVNDSGSYAFNITVNDSQDVASILVNVTIFDSLDTDGDGQPDDQDPDDDNDGLNDTVDYLLGNASAINISEEAVVLVNGSSNTSQVFNSSLIVNITDNVTPIIEFNWSFDKGNLNFYNLTIIRTDNGSNSSLLIKGLPLAQQNSSKTVYLRRLLNGTGICFKDADIDSLDEIGSTCTGSGEIWIECPGSASGRVCSYYANNSYYRITNLSYTGLKEQATYCGDAVCNGAESCSTCSTDCGACSSTPSSSSGGGGGGGGSFTITVIDENKTLKDSFLFMKQGEVYEVKGSPSELSVTKMSFTVNDFISKGSVVVNLTDRPEAVLRKAHQYFTISAGDQLSSPQVETAILEFRIEKGKLSNKSTVAVHRYTDGWEQINASRFKRDSLYHHYRATLPGFSLFAIRITDRAEEQEEQIIETVAAEEAVEEVTAAEEQKSYAWIWIIAGIAVLYIGITIFVKYEFSQFLRPKKAKRRKKQKRYK
ncbi:S8 family serine peptidase [Candidatus Woesearchaeota archaeon]|nr:S8 family serine peptidase [Candidatus Woesearchaeota archaeon]